MAASDDAPPPPRVIDWSQQAVRALAYVGDAVYELHVREKTLHKGGKLTDLHRDTVAQVSAAGQAAMVRRLLPHLTESEQGIFRRARNHKASSAPRRAAPQDYQLSTAFEAVLGYLHLKQDTARLNAILALTDTLLEEEPDAQ